MKIFNSEEREEGERYQSVKVRLLNLLGGRNDVTRQKAAELLGISVGNVSGAMTSLRKSGIRIFPSRGPGTPLKVVTTRTDAERYLNWTDSRYLGTAKRMVATASEFGEQYQELAGRPVVLLQTLNNATSQRPS